MKRLLAITITALFSIVFFALHFFQLYSAKNHGSIIASPEVTDFGVVAQGDVLNAKFSIINNTNKLFRIKDVVRACNCLDVSHSKDEIRPSGRTEIQFNWDTSG